MGILATTSPEEASTLEEVASADVSALALQRHDPDQTCSRDHVEGRLPYRHALFDLECVRIDSDDVGVVLTRTVLDGPHSRSVDHHGTVDACHAPVTSSVAASMRTNARKGEAPVGTHTSPAPTARL